MTVGIVVFPGSNCDRDMAWTLEGVLGLPTRFLWHGDTSLEGIDAVVLPGGFSYGDYLRCGALAGHSPLLHAVHAFAPVSSSVSVTEPRQRRQGEFPDCPWRGLLSMPAGNLGGA